MRALSPKRLFKLRDGAGAIANAEYARVSSAPTASLSNLPGAVPPAALRNGSCRLLRITAAVLVSARGTPDRLTVLLLAAGRGRQTRYRLRQTVDKSCNAFTLVAQWEIFLSAGTRWRSRAASHTGFRHSF